MILFLHQVNSIFERISEGMADKPFLRNVIQPYYAIENKCGGEDPAVRRISGRNCQINLELDLSIFLRTNVLPFAMRSQKLES